MIKTLIYPFLVSTLLVFTACETDSDANRNASNPPDNEEMSMLDGTYVLTTLDATPATDLNEDGTANVDVFAETDCFDVTQVTFNSDGTFTATNAKLDFNGGDNNDELICTSRTDSGMWSLEGSTLTLSVMLGDNTFMDSTEITLSDNAFSFTVTEAEVDEYVDDDGTTVASDIESLFLEYTKQ